jgi:predicted amidophosphoribosyltransferase
MQKQKKPKSKCTVCGRKVKKYTSLLCPSCNLLLGEGYEEEEILAYYHKDKKQN